METNIITATASDAQTDLELFAATGFFGQRAQSLRLLRDTDEILTSEHVEYCVIYGTLLGACRHQGFIPWDDDIDILIFNENQFANSNCEKRFAEKGYVVQPSYRYYPIWSRVFKQTTRDGYRIFSKDGIEVAGCEWRFPWIGTFQQKTKDGIMVIDKEPDRLPIDEMLPISRMPFADFSIAAPNKAERILDRWMSTGWKDYCVPSRYNHREERRTHFPQKQFPVQDVLEYLADAKRGTPHK